MHLMHHSCRQPAQLPVAELLALRGVDARKPRCAVCGVRLPPRSGAAGELHACMGLAVRSYTVDLSALQPFSSSLRSDCAFAAGADLRRCRPGHVVAVRTVPGAARPSCLHLWVGSSKMDLPAGGEGRPERRRGRGRRGWDANRPSGRASWARRARPRE
jgi:hypothetical protein